jgi:serine kinase of HPr protein (carbohydrate metabolism regulator)
MTATLHASCIAVAGRGVLIAGASGSGKSDLVLRMIDRGAQLVSDDYTILEARDGRLHACAPRAIAGRIEIRGVGIVEMPTSCEAPICLHLDLDGDAERLPDPNVIEIEGISLPTLAFAALEASAPIKLEQALRLHGISLS